MDDGEERAAKAADAALSADARWRSGMTGAARIHVPPRSVAYRLLALPLLRLVDFDLRRLR